MKLHFWVCNHFPFAQFHFAKKEDSSNIFSVGSRIALTLANMAKKQQQQNLFLYCLPHHYEYDFPAHNPISYVFLLVYVYASSWWPFSYGAVSKTRPSTVWQAIREMEICCYEGFRQLLANFFLSFLHTNGPPNATTESRQNRHSPKCFDLRLRASF